MCLDGTVALICASSVFPKSIRDDRSKRNFKMIAAMTARLATPADAAAIAAIYNAGIAERIATFETEPRTAEQIAAQLLHKADRFPTVVVECDGRIAAFAGAGPYRSRPCY